LSQERYIKKTKKGKQSRKKITEVTGFFLKTCSRPAVKSKPNIKKELKIAIIVRISSPSFVKDPKKA